MAEHTATMPKINEKEGKVLSTLFDLGGDELCFPFRPIAEECELSIAEIRRACRSLARKGLTQYHRGLWSEDGEPAGSGYRCTVAGAAKAGAMLDERAAKLPEKPRPPDCGSIMNCGWRRIRTHPPEANLWMCDHPDCPHTTFAAPARAEGSAS